MTAGKSDKLLPATLTEELVTAVFSFFVQFPPLKTCKKM